MALSKSLVLLFIFISLAHFVLGDYYKLLGVPRNADTNQLKKAFKKMSLKYHPDKNKNNKEQA